MIKVSDTVRAVSPFEEAFPEEYTVIEVNNEIDGGPVYFLDGVESGFAEKFLEVV